MQFANLICGIHIQLHAKVVVGKEVGNTAFLMELFNHIRPERSISLPYLARYSSVVIFSLERMLVSHPAIEAKPQQVPQLP